MGGEVDFIGVRAGRLEERLILTGRPGGKERSWYVPQGHQGLQKPQLCMYRLINYLMSEYSEKCHSQVHIIQRCKKRMKSCFWGGSGEMEKTFACFGILLPK